MDPWCAIDLVSGHRVLFGFAWRHPSTGGLSWLRSTPLFHLATVKRHAVTQSGRRYALGRQLAAKDMPDEGDEAWVAYQLLFGEDARNASTMPVIAVDPWHDARWLTAQKIARHLRVPPPPRAGEPVARFREQHGVAYLARRLR
jgi:hypothetical protein